MSNPRTFRLTAVALGVFGLAATLTATAGIPDCEHCLQDYRYCIQVDDYASCVQQLYDCQIAGRCEPTLPPD